MRTKVRSHLNVNTMATSITDANPQAENPKPQDGRNTKAVYLPAAN